MPTPSPNGDYTVTRMYSVPDDAWYLELDSVGGRRNLVTVIVPDEDPAREPTVCFPPGEGHADIPYDVMRWFMDLAEEQVRTSRAWMRLRPDLVEAVRRLRHEHGGCVDDDDFPRVLAEVRAVVAEADLASVLAAGLGRSPDGSLAGDTPATAPAQGMGDRGGPV
ncbi:hypothetical protein [Actinacidiphila bryophytorum]|uniref:hypothetical protein n=1 Tax=Actinacidiphila bryophytorum TaxID=1436133 RepID=UPI002176DD91|nr:hypothetical protein [Actinacidiphila bryophytorum]UWE07543.1 hypothetical protein NYE86_01520 [Actinacidiphila bryophytorum]